MNSATGLPFTKRVKATQGSPREEATFITLVSALVAWRQKRSLTCTALRPSGVRRTPRLVGAARANSYEDFTSMG